MVDIENLLVALDNDNNESIMNLTKSKMNEQKNNCLQRLQLGREKLKSFHKKLKEYKYCSDLSDLTYGNYIRWISLKDPENLTLKKGAIFCDYKIVNNMIHLVLKGNYGKIFEIKLDECEIFQKLSNQEKIILKVLDMINKD
tara:strand:- start:1918 stop:2343 length:426 start_codon:yes stop_codon:yes gene_type:complete